jgi:hypothetical protein
VHQVLALALSVAVVTQTPSIAESEDILRAVVAYIQMKPEDRIIAGLALDPSNTAFQGLHANRARFGQGDDVNLVPPDRVVVENVTVDGAIATVVVTYGPVPATPRLDCGQMITIPLRRVSASRWRVEEDGIWIKCWTDQPQELSADEARLLEAIRLVASQVGWAPSIRAVAGPQLSPRARRLISQLVPLKAADDVSDSTFVLPRDHVRFSSVQFTEDQVSIELTHGPVPREATLACGATSRIQLRRRAAGWFVASSSVTVC